MRVGRESIFSEWNNFDVFGITSTYFADKFGFTKYETEKILTYFGLQNHLSKVEEWYNGYLTQLEKSKYGNYKHKIPNNEVKIVFTDIIMKWLNTEVKIKRDMLIPTAENLINNKIKHENIIKLPIVFAGKEPYILPLKTDEK